MRRLVAGTIVITFIAFLAGRHCSAADSEAVNVLRLSTVSVEHSNALASEVAQLQALADGDDSTTATLTASQDLPFEVVYSFDGKTVAVEQLAVTVGAAEGDAAPPVHVDVLVSTLSPHAGFQSVRNDPLEANGQPQEFRFTPIAAKWVMLRFTPGPKSRRVAVAEVSVLGHEGSPVTRYQFKESPAKVLDVLKRLEKDTALNVSISKDEADLFEDAKDGKLDRWSFAEAALLSSGVLDAQERKRQLASLDKIEADARKAVADAKTPFNKGAALLSFLHAGPMAQGYVAQQTNVSAILETGTFNCVSSATMFNILGRRLGLDVRGIEVPEHAFSIQYDGAKHADVETTTAGGFNPSRDPAAQQEFTELTGFAYIPDSNRAERREVGDIGLVAITYYNRGVGFSEEKQYHAALLAYFRAMSLDPEFDSSVKGALGVLVNWSGELAGDKKHEEAIDVLSTGLALAPKDAALVNNHQFVWSDWAETLMKANRNDEALAILRRAAAAVPDGSFVRMQSWVFIRQGEAHIDAGEWKEAVALVKPGLEKLDREPREELAEWGESLHHRWAQSEEKEGRFDNAADVLDAALTEHPDDKRLGNHIAYVAQEWIRQTYADDGAAAAEKTVRTLLERYRQSDDVKQVAKSHLQQAVEDLRGKNQYEDALGAANRAAVLLKDEDLALDLARSVYDDWANELVAKEDWQAAIDVYGKGLDKFPKDEHLENNLDVTWDQWAQSFIKSEDWAGALGVYEAALTKLNDKSLAETNIVYCVQEWAKAVYDKDGTAAAKVLLTRQLRRFATITGLADVAESHVQQVVRKLTGQAKYDDALIALDQSKGLLKEETDVASIAGIVYDAWATEHQKAKEWQKAVDVYGKGLERFPKDEHLEQSAVATWNQWAETFMDTRDWAGAITIYEKAVEKYPDDSVLKNNLEFCQQQLEKKK